MRFELKLMRSGKNTVLSPSERWWENTLVCNASVMEVADATYLIYTARGEDGVAHLGYT